MIFPVDAARPWLVSGGAPLTWRFLRAESVLVGRRGVIIGRSAVRPGLEARGWSAARCVASARGLCEMANGVAFPVPPLVPEADPALDRCQTHEDARRVVGATGRYDVSACDVLDGERTFAYAGDVLYTREARMSGWRYTALCLLLLFLVRGLSQYMLRRQAEGGALMLPAAAVAVLLLALDGDAPYATETAAVSFWVLVSYVVAYGLLYVGSLAARCGEGAPFYNLLTGVLCLAALRMYGDMETPYTPPLLFMMATRTATKLRREKATAARDATLGLDGLALAVIVECGFAYDRLYLVPVALGAWMLAGAL